jgi:hypothetical protein
MVALTEDLNLPHARELLAAVADAQTRNETGEAAATLLNFLLRQLETLRRLANGYPRNPIDGSVWSDGKALAVLCDELTSILAGRALPEQEELASRLAVGMAVQVMSHYPEEIFPRIVRNGRCREANGEVDDAIDGYQAILMDSHRLRLLEVLDQDEPLEESSRLILASLAEAAGRLAELRPERRATLDALQSLLTRRLGQRQESARER